MFDILRPIRIWDPGDRMRFLILFFGDFGGGMRSNSTLLIVCVLRTYL